ncbi:uncharacterized protein LOC129763082 isoform X2 [Toxorhynchites rutilus septentrionalis]|uniref:uncharacterized protein LOC129763082 isoform X2 n=1 Tax=Toxorhynchites rutilus septentrionalis TaxID=329112 RepID=UPI00247A00F7|nr:uncharacterized protein LOC129763082 isoform X2 [Toxorhynchites rutilus septentrionalis]
MTHLSGRYIKRIIPIDPPVSYSSNSDQACALIDSPTMKLRLLLILYVALLCDQCECSLLKRSLRQLMKESKELLKTCESKSDFSWNCLKQVSLKAVDDFARSVKIPLVRGVCLVHVNNVNDTYAEADDGDDAGERRDSLLGSDDSTTNRTRSGLNVEPNARSDTGKTWQMHVLRALDRMLRTHVLQIELPHPSRHMKRWANSDKNIWRRRMDNSYIVEGRHRRHRQQMIPMMIFGVTIFGMFVVPIGFQFLAALSGKAFLMAKLALLLASINGLKRVGLT